MYELPNLTIENTEKSTELCELNEESLRLPPCGKLGLYAKLIECPTFEEQDGYVPGEQFMPIVSEDFDDFIAPHDEITRNLVKLLLMLVKRSSPEMEIFLTSDARRRQAHIVQCLVLAHSPFVGGGLRKKFWIWAGVLLRMCVEYEKPEVNEYREACIAKVKALGDEEKAERTAVFRVELLGTERPPRVLRPVIQNPSNEERGRLLEEYGQNKARPESVASRRLREATGGDDSEGSYQDDNASIASEDSALATPAGRRLLGKGKATALMPPPAVPDKSKKKKQPKKSKAKQATATDEDVDMSASSVATDTDNDAAMANEPDEGGTAPPRTQAEVDAVLKCPNPVVKAKPTRLKGGDFIENILTYKAPYPMKYEVENVKGTTKWPMDRKINKLTKKGEALYQWAQKRLPTQCIDPLADEENKKPEMFDPREFAKSLMKPDEYFGKPRSARRNGSATKVELSNPKYAFSHWFTTSKIILRERCPVFRVHPHELGIPFWVWQVYMKLVYMKRWGPEKWADRWYFKNGGTLRTSIKSMLEYHDNKGHFANPMAGVKGVKLNLVAQYHITKLMSKANYADTMMRAATEQDYSAAALGIDRIGSTTKIAIAQAEKRWKDNVDTANKAELFWRANEATRKKSRVYEAGAEALFTLVEALEAKVERLQVRCDRKDSKATEWENYAENLKMTIREEHRKYKTKLEEGDPEPMDEPDVDVSPSEGEQDTDSDGAEEGQLSIRDKDIIRKHIDMDKLPGEDSDVSSGLAFDNSAPLTDRIAKYIRSEKKSYYKFAKFIREQLREGDLAVSKTVDVFKSTYGYNMRQRRRLEKRLAKQKEQERLDRIEAQPEDDLGAEADEESDDSSSDSDGLGTAELDALEEQKRLDALVKQAAAAETSTADADGDTEMGNSEGGVLLPTAEDDAEFMAEDEALEEF